MLFLLLWLWWPVLVILWRLLKGARWRCWRYNFTALFVLPAPCSSHLLAIIIIIIIISSNKMHVQRKKGSLKKIRDKLAPKILSHLQINRSFWCRCRLRIWPSLLLMPPSFDWLKQMNTSCTIFKYFLRCTKGNHLNDEICALFPLMLFGWDQIWIVMSQHATSKQLNMWKKEWLWTQ